MLYPYPDPTPYRKPVENAALPGTLTRAEDDKEYAHLVEEVNEKRNQYFADALLDLALEFPDGKEVLKARFQARLAELAQWMDLPADEWKATLKYCIITGTREPELVAEIATLQAPLTLEEVVEGTAAYFRLDVSRLPTRPLARQTSGF